MIKMSSIKPMMEITVILISIIKPTMEMKISIVKAQIAIKTTMGLDISNVGTMFTSWE